MQRTHKHSATGTPVSAQAHGNGVQSALLRETVFNPILEKLLSLDKLREVYTASCEPDGTNIFNRILKHMNVACPVSDSDLARVPATGATVVVANHPFGILDGVLLGALLLKVRPDLKILTNYMLTGVPELDEYCIPLDPFGERQQSAVSAQLNQNQEQEPAEGGQNRVESTGKTAELATPSRKPETGCSNQRGLRGAKDWLNQGSMLLIFPAGEVAHLNPKQWRSGITDPKWNTTAFRLARSTGATTLPVFIDGRNSVRFQLVGLVHPRLRTARLAKEFLRKRGARVEVRVGNKLPAASLQLMAVGDAAGFVATRNGQVQNGTKRGSFHVEQNSAGGVRDLASANSRQPATSTSEGTQFLRWKTYILANRASKPHSSAAEPALSIAKLPRIALLSAAETLAEAVPVAHIEREIVQLAPSACLESNEDYAVYCASAPEIPHILREIGRLRELSFRKEGEGTGKALDLDRFDEHYSHLFVWNKPQREIVGAYRLAETADILRKFGVSGLYTNTLFRFKNEFFDQLGPAVELGRSFVRPEYQRQYAPLLLLWKAIGRFAALNPQNPVLFGAVSISNSYAPASRTLMYQFFKAQFATHPLAAMVQPRHPFRSGRLKHWDISAFNRLVRDPEELSGSISEFELDGKGIPILLKQYLKMGGEVLAFNVDGRFSDTLDGLIVVDLRNSDRKGLQRYLGSEGSARFLAYHRELETQYLAEPAD